MPENKSSLPIASIEKGYEDVLLKPWDLLAAEYIAEKAGCKVLRRDSEGLMAATGVFVTRSESLIGHFQKLFPHFFH